MFLLSYILIKYTVYKFNFIHEYRLLFRVILFCFLYSYLSDYTGLKQGAFLTLFLKNINSATGKRNQFLILLIP